MFFSSVCSFSQTNAPLVQIYDSTKVCDGYIYWTDYKTCHIMDNKGKVLFNFSGNLISFFYNKEAIVAQIDKKLVAYTKDLDVLWKYPTFSHHEMTVTPDDNVLLLSYGHNKINHTIILFDYILCFNSSGKLLYKWSTFDHRQELLSFMMKDEDIFRYNKRGLTDPDSLLFKMAPDLQISGMEPNTNNREFFHMNAIKVIGENASENKDPIFSKGNIILSFCNYNDSLSSFLAIVDPVNYKILWHYVMKNGKQMHTPSMLPNGNILVYVNANSPTDSSSIIEINPLTKKIVWCYSEKFPNPERRFIKGSCQRLPNGNTFISNNNGYIYEVTADKIIVRQWLISGEKALYRAFLYPREKLKWLVNDE